MGRSIPHLVHIAPPNTLFAHPRRGPLRHSRSAPLCRVVSHRELTRRPTDSQCGAPPRRFLRPVPLAPVRSLPASGCPPRSSQRRPAGDTAPWTVAGATSEIPRRDSVAALSGPASARPSGCDDGRSARRLSTRRWQFSQPAPGSGGSPRPRPPPTSRSLRALSCADASDATRAPRVACVRPTTIPPSPKTSTSAPPNS
jgi:hypothetical protein